MTHRILLLGTAASLALSSSLAPLPSRAGEVAAPFELTDPARIQAGKKRFGSTCAAYCHGAEGEGGKTPRFKGKVDFAPADAFKVITEGRAGTDVMPPWGKAFTSEQIWELVAYLQYLSTQPAPP